MVRILHRHRLRLFQPVIFFTVLLLFNLLLSGCGFGAAREMLEKERIIQYVQENESLLTQCILDGDYDPLSDSAVIEDIEHAPEAVDFSCGGSGFGSQTNYWGFFYSETDNLLAVWCAITDGRSEKDGEGRIWYEPNSDNTYYVQHICSHFYYYYAHF